MNGYVYQPDARMDFGMVARTLRGHGYRVIEQGIDHISPGHPIDARDLDPWACARFAFAATRR